MNKSLQAIERNVKNEIENPKLFNNVIDINTVKTVGVDVTFKGLNIRFTPCQNLKAGNREYGDQLAIIQCNTADGMDWAIQGDIDASDYNDELQAPIWTIRGEDNNEHKVKVQLIPCNPVKGVGFYNGPEGHRWMKIRSGDKLQLIIYRDQVIEVDTYPLNVRVATFKK